MGTTYKGLYLPAVSETGWGASANNNFTKTADEIGQLFLPAATGTNEAGVGPVVAGTFPNQSCYFLLPSASTAGALWIFQLPHMAATSTFTVRPFWYAQSQDLSAHSIRWQLDAKLIDTTGSATGGIHGVGTTIAWTGNSISHGGALTYLEDGQVSTGVTVTPDSPVRLAIQRLGADALDTFTGNAALMGVQIDATGA